MAPARRPAGRPVAQLYLGNLYSEGRGVPQDDSKAAKWYQRAAQRGSPGAAELSLSSMYRTGRVVPQDDAEAAKWARRAAEQGYCRAQIGLGFMYARGRGVPQDYVLAQMWFLLAGLCNYSAFSAAGRLTPDQLAEAQRLARELKLELEQQSNDRLAASPMPRVCLGGDATPLPDLYYWHLEIC